MRSARFKLRFWMLEIPVWILGLLWAMSAGADNLHLEPLNQGFNKVLQSSQSQLVQDPLGGAARARMQAAYGRLPLGFESNQGQADPSIRFLSRSPGAGLFFKNNEVLLQTQDLRSPVALPSSNNTDAGEQTRIHLQWLGSNANPVLDRRGSFGSQEPLPGRRPAAIGASMFPTTRASVTKPSILESISSFMAIQNSLNMTLCSPREPTPPLSFCVSKVWTQPALSALSPWTRMVISGYATRTGAIRQHKPVAFQKTKVGQKVVASQYVILNDGLTVGFKLGEYDPSLPLIIDPCCLTP